MNKSGVTYLDWWDFYFRIESLAHTYLQGGVDAVCYVTSGGMSVAHRLIHALNLTIDKRFIVALPIARHRSHEIQAQPQDVRADGEYDLRALDGKHVLLVDDAVGSGQTLAAAHALVGAANPRRIDTFILGVDHRDRNHRPHPPAHRLIETAVVGFDYWGWLIFPWEAQAADGFGTATAPTPYHRMSAAQRCAALTRAQPLGGARSIEACRIALRAQQQAAPLIALPNALPGLFETPKQQIAALCLPHALPSQIGCAHWQDVLRAAVCWLAPGGLLCFDYAERMSVRAGDALTVCGIRLERYTAPLLAQIAHNAGFDVLDARPADAHNIATMCITVRP
jgi:uncharacterized protein